ncbi:uncharacterized protein [Physcomitrium patens]|uniref:uncharacterized protein isoform X3 n=1 Tax=Physcomitrium patens TaxID=3218 RepID=UPI003CCDD6F2
MRDKGPGLSSPIRQANFYNIELRFFFILIKPATHYRWPDLKFEDSSSTLKETCIGSNLRAKAWESCFGCPLTTYISQLDLQVGLSETKSLSLAHKIGQRLSSYSSS